MSDQIDSEVLQVLGRQARQYSCVDLVRAERRLVLLEPQLPQPICDIHRRHAVTLLRIRLTRRLSRIGTPPGGHIANYAIYYSATILLYSDAMVQRILGSECHSARKR